jgi:hypothetical protein
VLPPSCITIFKEHRCIFEQRTNHNSYLHAPCIKTEEGNGPGTRRKEFVKQENGVYRCDMVLLQV